MAGFCFDPDRNQFALEGTIFLRDDNHKGQKRILCDKSKKE